LLAWVESMLDNNLINGIKSALTNLLNQRLQEVGRAANMLWICFGEQIEVKNIRGEYVIKYKYALHIQCDWKISGGAKININQDDFYKSSVNPSSEFADIMEFGNNKFDDISYDFNNIIKTNLIYVVNFEVDTTGGFKLVLNNGTTICVQAGIPSEGESWRFLMPGSGKDQQAVIDLAKQAQQRGGISEGDATILLRWAREAGLRTRGPEIHIFRPNPFEHIHIGPIGHIPIR